MGCSYRPGRGSRRSHRTAALTARVAPREDFLYARDMENIESIHLVVLLVGYLVYQLGALGYSLGKKKER